MRRPALALILGCLLLVTGASALDGYDYYQTIEYAACDQEIYQQDIVIHRTTGTAYNETAGGLETWHIYVGEHCREDYGDVRFTNSTGAELAYYLWPDHDSSSARFVVRLTGANAAGSLVTWYGNAGATTTSSGTATYLFFDDFLGASLDTTKWNTWLSGGSTTVSDGVLHVQGGAAWHCVGSKTKFAPGHIFEFRAYTNGQTNDGWIIGGDERTVTGGTSGGLDAFGVEYGVSTSKYSGYAQWNAGTYSRVSRSQSVVGSFHRIQEIWAPASIIYLVDGVFGANIADRVPANTCGINFQVLNAANAIHVDFCGVRAYSATPPAATTFHYAAPPVTAFTATPTAGLAPLTVQFTDLSGGLPTSWLWSFGDGNTSTAQNPQHTYTAPGLYTVTLNATNEYGSDAETKTNYITVYSPVTAQFMADVTYGALPLTVQFTDASSGSPTSWTWDFGDGNTSTDQNPEHTYTSTGTYTVKLIASHPYDSDEETKVNYITVVTLQPFPGCSSNPTDPDSDGLYEDINGNGRWDFQDLVLFFQHLTWCNANQPITLFDWNSNFRCDFDDVHKLWLDGGMI
jgi:PKD repeat protein